MTWTSLLFPLGYILGCLASYFRYKNRLTAEQCKAICDKYSPTAIRKATPIIIREYLDSNPDTAHISFSITDLITSDLTVGPDGINVND